MTQLTVHEKLDKLMTLHVQAPFNETERGALKTLLKENRTRRPHGHGEEYWGTVIDVVELFLLGKRKRHDT